MKKIIGIIYIILIVFSGSIKAQKTYFTPVETAKKDSTVQTSQGRDMIADNKQRVTEHKTDTVKTPQKYGWILDTRSGARILVETQKTLDNFHRSTLMEGKGLAVQYIGNVGSPAQSLLFFEREEGSAYKFLDPFSYYYKRPEDVVFINTKVPYSNIFYQSGGGRNEKEERFKTEFTLNSGKKFNFGFNIDYLYSRGFYNWLANKQFTYDMYASYLTDKYQMHAYVMNNYYNNSENGGIQDDRFIINPNDPNLADLWSKGKSSKDIPVNMQRLWNKMQGRQVFLSNKYNVGTEREMIGTDGETEFIPVASFVLTSHYADQRRRFASKDETKVAPSWSNRPVLATDTVYYNSLSDYNNPENGYNNSFINTGNESLANDYMAYWSFKNTFALTLNEGFRDWVKFGLTAFIEQDIRKYTLPNQFPGAFNKESQNSTVIGGILSKQKGRYLRYNLKADLSIVGYNMGEYRVEGDVSTNIRIAEQNASVKAKAYIKNLKPSFYENHYRTKYMHWDHDFSNIHRVFVGGEINVPQTKTRISGGVENIENYIYYDTGKQIAQTSKNIQVISVRLDQNFKAGIFHWENSVAYQFTKEKDVLPLPELSLYSNIYIKTQLIKVLTLQLGADINYTSKYYAQGYDPALLQFHNQKNTKVGGFPFVTGYLNLNLKYTRFFLMMYNLAESSGGTGYFNTPHYPVPPMTFKLGISWDFNN